MLIEQGEWRSRKESLRDTTYSYRVVVDVDLIGSGHKSPKAQMFSDMQRWCVANAGVVGTDWNSRMLTIRTETTLLTGSTPMDAVRLRRRPCFMFADDTTAVGFLMRFG